VALKTLAVLNRTRALDLIGDTLYGGRCYRTLNVPDEGNRESLAIEISTSLLCARVVQMLELLVAISGAQGMPRVDNGPEFIWQALVRLWAQHGVVLDCIQPDVSPRSPRCLGPPVAGGGPADHQRMARALQHRAAASQSQPSAAADLITEIKEAT
jgi:hypothetical protein